MTRLYTKRELLQDASAAGFGLLLSSSPGVGNVTLFTPQSPSFNQLRQGFNERIDKYPKVIAVCHNANGVTDAVNYAAKNRLSVAIRSGGHSFEGFSCNNGGLVINLSQLNQIEWLNSTTVRVGPGVTLSHLYDALLPHKRIVPTGSCGGVGIAGLALGGGYGFFSRSYGLTCDSLLDVTMVDSRGVVHRGASEPDLLWACRGGGNGSFGVVTEMVFKTHPAPSSFRSYRFKLGGLDGPKAAHLLENWFTLAAELPRSCFSAFVLNSKGLVILITDFEAPTPQLRRLLERAGSMARSSSTGRPQNLAAALKVYYGRPGPLSFKNSSGGMYRGFDDVRGCAVAMLNLVTSHPGLMYQVNTLGGSIADPGFGAASCFPHRSRPFLSELQSYWSTPAQEANLHKAFRQVQNLLLQNGVTAHYANYPDLEFTDWQHAYYGASYPRLQAIKRRYDPGNLFQHEQSVRA